MSKIKLLYHPDSEHDPLVRSYCHDYQKLTGKDIELVSLETKEGDWLASSVEVTQYPAILAVTDDDSTVVKMWQGEPLPLLSEVAYYDHPA